MTDPAQLEDALDAATDAFGHADSPPRIEPGIDSSHSADGGKITLQKACRLLASAGWVYENSDFYTSVLEHSFAALERSIESYLIIVTGDDPADLKDHSTPYERAKVQVPLEEESVRRIEQFYDGNRTSYYYGTSVATAQQAEAMLDLASAVHDHLVGFDSDLDRSCLCET